MHTTAPAAPPLEVFAPWRLAQRELDRHALQPPPSAHVLRTTGFLEPELAEQVATWFLDDVTAGEVFAAYGALADETAQLFAVIQDRLHLRVAVIDSENDPYPGAAELCADLREHGTLTLARDAPHPLLGDRFDELRVIHDVLGHAALGLGFDLQSEFATWLQCRTLFSAAARPAAFCELVGTVTAYVVTGEKPGLRAKLPPAGLLAACER